MLSILRASVPRTNTASQTRVMLEDGQSSMELLPASTGHFMRTVTPPARVSTFFLPPLHYHMYQREHFHVISGSARFIVEGEERIVRERDKVDVPVAVYHRYENASADSPLVMDSMYDPGDRPVEERFFRNFFGYLDDCRKAKTEPSVFQLMLFLVAVDTPLSLPLPGPAWLRQRMDYLFMLAMGKVMGQWLLGYQVGYREYYKEEAR